MAARSRVRNSIRNTVNGLFSEIVSLVLNFIVRTYFILYLDEVYLGINELFTNVLTMLSLAELGFGSAMVYSMYKPLAENNIPKLKALMNLYAKVYSVIGSIIALLGIALIPFIHRFIKGSPNIDNLNYIYLMFLANSVLSYFFAYKRSILSADQKQYINSRYRYIFTVIKAVLQVCILILTRSFMLFLVVKIITTVLENICIFIKVNKIYPFLNGKNEERLTKEELKLISNDVKALMLTKLGDVMLNGTDNLIISAFIGISWVGKLSNYNLITSSVIIVLSQVFTGLTASIGNFIVKEEKEKQYNLFKIIDLCNFWIYGFSFICLVVLLNPFIKLWIGEALLLNQTTVIVISINFLINGVMSSFWMFRSAMGLFTQGKYRPVIAAVLNISISIILSKYYGMIGVLLGTTFSRVTISLWFDLYIIFKYGFEKSPKTYYLKYLLRILLLVMLTAVIYVINSFLMYRGITIWKFILLMIMCTIIPNLVFLLIYYKTSEFKYLLGAAKEFGVNFKQEV